MNETVFPYWRLDQFLWVAKTTLHDHNLHGLFAQCEDMAKYGQRPYRPRWASQAGADALGSREENLENWVDMEERPSTPDSVVACPLCLSQTKSLDYHHWCYQSDIGIEICRRCHDEIHNPNGARPRESVGNEWVDYAIPVLVSIYLDVDRIMEKFNIPEKHRPVVQESLEQYIPDLVDQADK